MYTKCMGTGLTIGLQLAECATFPSQAFPKRDDEPPDRTSLYLAGGAAVAAFTAAVILWKKSSSAGS
jgi:Ras family protein T1